MKKHLWILAAATLIIVGLILNYYGTNTTSIGRFASGYFAAGTFATGVFAAGTFAIGIFSIGIFSIGIFSVGIFNIALYAIGIFFIAWKKRQLKINIDQKAECEDGRLENLKI